MGRDCLGYDATTLFVPPNVAANRSFLSKLRLTQNNTVTGHSEYAYRTLRIKKGRSKRTGNEMVTITGSLATFLNGDNFHSLNFEEFSTALEKLSDELGFNCGECYVWKIEFAGTFSTSDKPSLYFPCFQARPGLHAKNMDSGVYLQNKSRILVIHVYDKSYEQNPSTIRLEVRRNKAVPKAIGRPYPFLASELATREVFESFAHYWYKQIISILVLPNQLPTFPERLTRKSVAQIESQLCRSDERTLSKLIQIVEAYDSAGLLSKDYRSELRRELYGPHSETENNRLLELRSKIETIMKLHSEGLQG